jgi:hypothetical protein
VLRLATPIKQGTVTASLMLKKLASYPRQNGLTKALREIGRIERTLFMPDWFRDPALRRRVQAGLNKSEARNALARAIFMHRPGEIRDRKPENQSYRASGLTLLTAAIALWNTVYMERAVDALKRKGVKINGQLLSHLSPPGWEYINLTGDYIWKSNRIPASGKFRRLRPAKVEKVKKTALTYNNFRYPDSPLSCPLNFISHLGNEAGNLLFKYFNPVMGLFKSCFPP